ncbi:MAG TPA: RsmG family class I SAM-dependent methyltransferase [Thermoanaerobaculia bacterium]
MKQSARHSIPAIPRGRFDNTLLALSPAPLSPHTLDALYAHYEELRRWSGQLNLIGPGTAQEVLERHFGESLAALPLLPEGPADLLDVGSGAGFPGLVLAAARPDLAVTLVEARERRWAFLQSAARRAALPCRCLNARVRLPLPAGLPESIGVVTLRALRLEPEVLAALAARFGPEGRVLLWAGGEEPPLPPGLVPGREVRLPGSARRRILEFRPAAAAAHRTP